MGWLRPAATSAAVLALIVVEVTGLPPQAAFSQTACPQGNLVVLDAAGVTQIDGPVGVTVAAPPAAAGGAHTALPPQFAAETLRQMAADSPTVIELDRDGFTAQAEAALRYAADVWEAHLASTVPIRIHVISQVLPGTLLGVGGPSLFLPVSGAFWFPAALYEAVHEEILGAERPDITFSLNSAANWYYGTDGRPGPSQMDLATVAIHEIGHGLGFADSFDVESGVGSFGLAPTQGPAVPIIFDSFVADASGERLIDRFPTASPALATTLTSGGLFFDGPQARAAADGAPRLYAPSSWTPGSSVSHLDPTAFPRQGPNGLMGPQIAPGTANHDPGPVADAILGDLGWPLADPVSTSTTSTSTSTTSSSTTTTTTEGSSSTSTSATTSSTTSTSTTTTTVGTSPTSTTGPQGGTTTTSSSSTTTTGPGGCTTIIRSAASPAPGSPSTPAPPAIVSPLASGGGGTLPVTGERRDRAFFAVLVGTLAVVGGERARHHARDRR